MEVEGNGETKNNDGDRSEVSGEKMRKKWMYNGSND